MFRLRLVALAVFPVLLSAHLATAQPVTFRAPEFSDGSTGASLIARAVADVTDPGAASAMQTGRRARRTAGRAERTLQTRLFAGLWTNDGTGFVLGGGVAAHPFTKRKHEVQANLAYQHVESSDGFGVDLDYIYNFLDTDAGGFTPYAGAGIKIDHFEGDTDSHLQIGGGLRKPLGGGKTLFGEIWFVLGDLDPIILRAGVGW